MSDYKTDDRLINELQNAVKTEIIKDSLGNEYSTRALFPLKEKEKQPASPSRFDLHTLTGLVDFCLRHKEEKGPEDPAGLYIADHSQVLLLSEPFGPEKKRTQFVKAGFEALLGTSFKFGEFYDQEAFVIGLQSLFEPTPARDEVIKLVATIKRDQSAEWTDSGVSQTVIAKTGIAKVGEAQVPNPVRLKPFRTFREIDQPESPFVLRIREGRSGPESALFEADGGRWKLAAIQLIKEYLEDKVELPIIA